MKTGSSARLRRLLADSFAMVTFSTAVGMASEMGVAGMDFPHSLHARLVAVPANLLTARPYGIWRDWFLSKTLPAGSGRIRAALCDLAAFTLFQIPLYASILAASGATWGQIAAACATAMVLCVATGRPYGVYLDWCRKFFGGEERNRAR